MRFVHTMLVVAACCLGAFGGQTRCCAAQAAPAATPAVAPPAVSRNAPPAPSSAASAAASAAAPGAPRRLDLAIQPRFGDFDAMLDRRVIRVLVPYSRTLYFNELGHERGLTAGLMRDFERYLNKVYQPVLGKRPLTLIIIPTTRDQLLPALVAGKGDIAAGNLTATDARLKQVDFVAPRDRTPVRELVVTGPKSPALTTLDDLSGKTVHVRASSSYFDSLTALNARFKKEGKAPVKLVLLPDALEDEDAMEMLNVGLIQILVVDDWKAKFWDQVLPNIVVHDKLAVREGGYIGWAIRKQSPKLQQAINDFYRDYVKKQSVAEVRLRQELQRVKQISNNAESAELKRFSDTVALFEKYGSQYHFDPLMLAAQGYQESQLNQNARSHVGAIGIMQLMPATGKELAVGDIKVTEANIHAGAKYLDKLMARYFPDAKFSDTDRALFAFASYNAGPSNIAKMRKEAAARGLSADKWFNNVEIVVGEKIGIETTTYVRNIYKYYAAYRLIQDAQAARQRALGQVRKSQ
ncbi:transporter substrate-binding domain-containing protein [Paraburkholderia sp. MMS20-SJTR3]|uniref:Transporter substrate-binding domain-containing protein n=1 Tax=Paraburkholderia sejongensis TaxID=2886946 RepID=A0ABS8K328_9BURK|nr:transporter substrate-binding domain-containing protein [Paraburkholderia sp. MMS20-SJTR3]MCC8396562.1 transporter substrate-binding domain-containing protein [Paraburkholderia sp. MMS20-SJTR3]